ncbi:MAG: hypothetical protein MI806_34710 [Minwuiales bacterium]|nr:hypothetical protein [Minwuiales bacterium]
MNRWLKTAVVAAGVMVFGMVAAASADAGNKHRHHGFHAGYHGKHHWRHRGYRKHYGHWKHRGYRKFYGHRHFHRFGRHRHGLRKYHYGYRRPFLGFSYSFHHAPHAYKWRPAYPRRTVVVRERTVVRNTAPVTRPAPQADTCLQEREYQTTVTVGGQQVDGYGTACLQPDGSWRRGPARAAPTFD